jgi:alpha-L-fucosidase
MPESVYLYQRKSAQQFSSINMTIQFRKPIKSHLIIWLLFATGLCMGACKTETHYTRTVIFDNNATNTQKVRKATHVIPTPQQQDWQNLELTAFVHFGINTFTGREWGDGTESPELFDPENFDAFQWVRTLQEGGMRMVILTAKHHDGFCLWPTKTTQHSVSASPWRNGKGDVVMELKSACDSLGMKFGVYLSPWDRNAACYGDSPRYNAFFEQQLTELLTIYGKVDEVWFDGACGEGPGGRTQIYDWASWYELIHKLQPNAVVAVKGEDIRWVGTESGYGRPTEWSVTAFAPGGRPEMEAINQKLGLSETTHDLGSREVIAKADQLFWYPAEVDVSIRPGWFFHESENEKVKSLAHLADIYFNSVGMNAVLLLNVPPDKRGLIHEADAARLKDFKKWLDDTFTQNLLEISRANSKNAQKAIDGNGETFHEIKKFPTSFEIELNEPQEFNVFEIREYIKKGQRVESFTVEAMINGNWQKIAEGTTIGYKRLLRFEPVETEKIRVTINKARHHALIAEIGLYSSPEMLSDPVIVRDKTGMVFISSEIASPNITYTTDGSEPTSESQPYFQPFTLKEGGMVKARAFILNGGQFSGVISETFDLCPAKWKIVESTASASAFPASYAVDGNNSTMWHTPWSENAMPMPQSITIDLGEELKLKGFSYTPRNDGNFSGTALRYSFDISTDGINWATIIDKQLFNNMDNNPSKQVIHFDQMESANFIKFTSHESIFGESWLSVAELGVITR